MRKFKNSYYFLWNLRGSNNSQINWNQTKISLNLRTLLFVLLKMNPITLKVLSIYFIVGSHI